MSQENCGTGVLVGAAGGGTGVWVRVAVGGAGRGVFVRVGGTAVSVAVGGTGVFVTVGVLVRVGVGVNTGVGVSEGVGVKVGRLVRVGRGVEVGSARTRTGRAGAAQARLKRESAPISGAHRRADLVKTVPPYNLETFLWNASTLRTAPVPLRSRLNETPRIIA
jgi:hypothetical protein